MDDGSKMKKAPSDMELAARAVANRISPLKYWEEYVDYAKAHKSDPKKWNRDEFLKHLRDVVGADVSPLGSAIASKHNYVTTQLIPKLGMDPTSPWRGLTEEHLKKAKLPPTARDTTETWVQDSELALATRALFGA